MATEKLYWADSTARSFEAESARLGRWQDRPSLVLPRTLFYPEAGGQLADHGTLVVGARSVAIDDAQIDDDGVIHHLGAELAGLAEGDLGPARGTIDDARRRDFTAQHTAQHALSRALLDEANAPTVSSRLGSTLCTIDVDRADIPEREIARAEDLVNALVMDDAPVRTLFPTAEELARMDLRRAPKVTANVRIVDIGGFDLTPCGGTHCTRTGQIGAVRVVGVERYKGKTRPSERSRTRARRRRRSRPSPPGSRAACSTWAAPSRSSRRTSARARTRSPLRAESSRRASPKTPGARTPRPPRATPPRRSSSSCARTTMWARCARWSPAWRRGRTWSPWAPFATRNPGT
jgi:alanyl-tRNA synthetase